MVTHRSKVNDPSKEELSNELSEEFVQGIWKRVAVVVWSVLVFSLAGIAGWSASTIWSVDRDCAVVQARLISIDSKIVSLEAAITSVRNQLQGIPESKELARIVRDVDRLLEFKRIDESFHIEVRSFMQPRK